MNISNLIFIIIIYYLILLSEIDIEQPFKQRKTVPRILDGKYFEILKTEGDKIEAKCTECLQVRKGTLKSTGNFMEHYRSKHGNLVNDIENYRKKNETINKSLKQTTLQPMSPIISLKVVSFKRRFLFFKQIYQQMFFFIIFHSCLNL